MAKDRRKETDLALAGSTAESIPVTLSYRIIQHFSAGLYTSPNKAFEELVANSYDAGATKVEVIVPTSLEQETAVVWVVDDGSAMDVEGFRELWRIGESAKREKPTTGRLPMGKFGIGKLATYVLAKELTYICRKDGKYYAITMDFGLLESDPDLKQLDLDVRNLTEDEAKSVLSDVTDSISSIQLFGSGSASSWTAVALRQFKPLAFKLKRGRLSWVLRTALPLSPGFSLTFNGKELESPKVERPRIDSWTVGVNDAVATKLEFEATEVDGVPYVEVHELGKIHGHAELYEDPLPGGKAEGLGRSHGFFVVVRGRVINLHDELFGLEQLSHGVFSRFRMVVYADDLDEHLRSTRESVNESAEGVVQLRNYLKAVFNSARQRYTDWVTSEESERSVSSRVSRTPRAISREPLIRAIKRALDDPQIDLLLTDVPSGLDEGEKTALIEDLESRVDGEEFFEAVQFESLGMERGVAVFDASTRRVRVNIDHPFFANYTEHYKSPEPFQLIAVTEVLTESYLLDEGLSTDQARNVLERRDRFLRELVFGTQLAAPLLAQLLEDNRSSSSGFEDAVAEGLRSLGFEVSPIGGKGKPDGIALARLGVTGDSGGSASYRITYDAKSSAHERVKAHTVGVATIRQHRDDHNADHAIVVAPGFEGERDEDSNIVKQSREHRITCIRLDDFVGLILLASLRPLGLRRLKEEFLEKCYTPQESRAFVEVFAADEEGAQPVQEILEAVWAMQKDSPDPPTSPGIRERVAAAHEHLSGITRLEIEEWMMSVRRIVGGLVVVSGQQINLEAPPEQILERVHANKSKLPQTYIDRFRREGD